MNKIEHLGIAVRDLALSEKIFTDVLGVAPYKREHVESEHVITSFFQIGDSKIELLQATSEQSSIHGFIEKRGEGIHHIAFAVSNIEQEILRLVSLGYTLIHHEPKDGADNKRIAFLHPSSTNKVLIELCADKD